MSDLKNMDKALQSRPKAVEGEVVNDKELAERVVKAKDELKAAIEATNSPWLITAGGHLTRAGSSRIKLVDGGEDISRTGVSISRLPNPDLPSIEPAIAMVEFNNINTHTVDMEAPFMPANDKDEIDITFNRNKLPKELLDQIGDISVPRIGNLVGGLKMAYHIFQDGRVEKRIRMPRHLVDPKASVPEIYESSQEAMRWKSVPMKETDYKRAEGILKGLTTVVPKP